MSIKDFSGLSEPLKRLIEVVATGVGQIFLPQLIKRTADARAYEISTIASAIDEATKDSNLPISYKTDQIEIWKKPEDLTVVIDQKSIEERLSKRTNFIERKRQNNLEQIVQKASVNLMDIEHVTEIRPEEDWISRFFMYAQDISSSEMQELWGRILSGEIKRPGSYSLRTLDSVRNLSKKEAELFENLSKFAINSNGIWFIPMFDVNFLKDKLDIYPSHHFSLSELGLMYPTDLQLSILSNTNQALLTTEQTLLQINRKDHKKNGEINIWKYTQIGKEIISLIEKPYNLEYYRLLAEYYRKLKCEVIVGNIIKYLPDGRIEYNEIFKLEPNTDSET